MSLRYYILSVSFIILVLQTSAQRPAPAADTVAINRLDSLGARCTYNEEYAKADSFAALAIKLSESINYKAGIASAYLVKGNDEEGRGEYVKASDFYNRSVQLAEGLPDKRLLASALHGSGSAYEYLGNYARATELYFRAQQIFEGLHDKDGMGQTHNSLGRIYDMEGNHDEALKNYNRSLEIYKELKDTSNIALLINNIAIVYDEEKMYDKALEQFTLSLNIYIKRGDKRNQAMLLNNMADIYSATGKNDSSLALFDRAINLYKQVGDKQGIELILGNIGNIYGKQGQYKLSIDYLNRAEAIAREISALGDVKEDEGMLADVYDSLGQHMLALQHYKAYIALRDSIFNQEKTKKIVQSEMNYEFEKKQAAEKAEQDKKDAIQKEQARKQQLIIYFFSAILLLVAAIAIFVYRSYLQKQKANRELSFKNEKIEGAHRIIEEKNREITDSINYARRIQNAMLPSKDEMQKFLPESFVLFKPKDIVSGDFYFYTPRPVGEGQGVRSVIATCDCTGHGVPGAFMSLIGSEKLKDAVEQQQDTGSILSALNKGIKQALHQSGADSTKDGMDIALAMIQSPFRGLGQGGRAVLSYSGANRPLWIVRNGKSEIEEIKATKKAIGGFTEDGEKFESHQVNLQKGDTIYMFTDGYADQFGGKEGKKITTKRFRQLITSICQWPMAQQEKELDTFIENWKGALEQTDDICVIGIRI